MGSDEASDGVTGEPLTKATVLEPTTTTASGGDVVDDNPQPRPIAGLVAVGFRLDRARAIVEEFGAEAVATQLTNLQRTAGVKRPRSWLLAALRDNYELEDDPQEVFVIPDPPTPEEAEAKARELFPNRFEPVTP